MRKISIITLLSLCIAVSAQEIQFTKGKEYNFGNIPELGGRVTTVFEYVNTGNAPLVLTSVRTSCGCTAPTWTDEPLEPGQRGMIKVTYNASGRPGRFQKTITVTSNAITTPTEKLYIKGEVFPGVATVSSPGVVGFTGGGANTNLASTTTSSSTQSSTPSQPPLFSMVDGSLKFVDKTNNNRIDADEKCNIIFKILNSGKGTAVGCEVRVRITGSKEGIVAKNIPLPTIASGETYEVNIPIASNVNTQNGNATFSIEVYEPNGWGVAPFDLTVATKAYEAPFLQVVDYNISSISGKIRKMEPFTLTFNLQNTQYGDAENVHVKVNLPANVFVMDGNSELSYPLIKSGEVKSIQITLAANNNYASTNIPVTIDIKEKHGKFSENKSLDIALNQSTSGSINIAAKDEPEQERHEIQKAMLTSEVDRNIPSTGTKNPNTFVLIIANENYQQVASVPFALNDGKVFKQYCEKTLGIPANNIRLQNNATGGQIQAQLDWLKSVVGMFDDPSIILYYAGHGIPDEANKTAYLLPVDGYTNNLKTCIKLDELYASLGTLPAKQITVFMDACFSGSKREQGMLASARAVALKTNPGSPQGNMVVFSAAQGDETAYPDREQQHGLFTYYLLKKLQETQGDITLKALGDYITKEVSRQSLIVNSKKQTPTVTASYTLGSDWQLWTLK